MAFNLIDAAKNMLPGELVSQAAGSLGENEAGIQKALSAALPSVLGGLLSRSIAGRGSDLLEMVKGAAGSGNLNNLGDLFDDDADSSKVTGMRSAVMGWLRSLFGDKLNNVVNAIAGFAGIKTSSANTLLSLAAPATLASVGNYAVENNLGPDEIGSFLQSQKGSILSSVPSGFNLAGALGISSLADIGGRIGTGAISATEYTDDATGNPRSAGYKWVWPLILLIALAALVWFFSQRGCKDATTTPIDDTATATIAPEPAPIETPRTAGMLDTVTGNYIYNTGNEVELRMLDGTIIRAGDNSTEAKLYHMLSSGNFIIDTLNKSRNWVTFDRVFFETGRSVLTDASKKQVSNVAAILKNFPGGSIKIGGYTDNTGDAVSNKKISEARAKTVRQELIKQGAGKTQVTEAIGYGPDHPVCPANDKPECKAQNRRVDLKLASK